MEQRQIVCPKCQAVFTYTVGPREKKLREQHCRCGYYFKPQDALRRVGSNRAVATPTFLFGRKARLAAKRAADKGKAERSLQPPGAPGG